MLGAHGHGQNEDDDQGRQSAPSLPLHDGARRDAGARQEGPGHEDRRKEGGEEDERGENGNGKSR